MFQWFSKSFEQGISIAPPMYLWQLNWEDAWCLCECVHMCSVCWSLVFIWENIYPNLRFLISLGFPATIETLLFPHMISFIAQLTRNMIFLTRMLIRGKELNWFVNINLIGGSVYSLSLIPSTSRSDGTAIPHDGSRMGFRLRKDIGPQPSPSLDQYTTDTSQVYSRQDLRKDTFPLWTLEILSLYLHVVTASQDRWRPTPRPGKLCCLFHNPPTPLPQLCQLNQDFYKLPCPWPHSRIVAQWAKILYLKQLTF